MEGETASETEKRLKKRKNKTAESRERLISTHFCGFPLYQFRCCDVLGHAEISSTKQYISLDSVHLKECSLGLTGIEQAGGTAYE